ncbi:MAG: hypothetical protein CVV27_11925 [Candidatus Melainabacteria bacterium HGW-Melainabacteria-1]|nr:MAG: hypothetical protein CVV27_11925 [Candidatus Melainabacteria bacterium HGW-Melainabacteria-1]
MRPKGALLALSKPLLTALCVSGLTQTSALARPIERPVQEATLSLYNAAAAEQLSQQLRQKLTELGSFEAEYKALSPESAAEIQIVYNLQRRFSLAEVKVLGPDPLTQWIVIDFAPLQTKDGGSGLRMLMISPEGIQSFTVSLDELFGRLDNPMGFLRFLSDQLSDGQTAPEGPAPDNSFEPGAPLLTLGIGEQNLSLSLGLSSRPGGLVASWLEPEQLATAREVTENKDKVTFVYPQNHQVIIDAKTGLLLLDQWPDPNRRGPREIKLVRHAALVRDLPYQELIPGFERLPSEELPATALYAQLAPGMLSDLAQQLRKGSALEAVQAKASGAGLLAAARTSIRQLAIPPKPAELQDYLTQILRPAYARFRQQYPSERMSFRQFLDLYQRTAEADPDAVDQPPGSEQQMANLVQSLRAALSQVPADDAAPLAQLAEWGLPSLAAAWKLELLSLSLDQIKDMAID